jgi:hypothetical protein
VLYEPYAPAIDAMMQTIFAHAWSLDYRLPKLEQQIRLSQIEARAYL